MSAQLKKSDIKICHYGYDLSKRWFVYLYFTHPETGKRVLRPYRGDINKYNNRKERIQEAGDLKDALWEKIKDGWNPLIKEDQEAFKTILECLEQMYKLKDSQLKSSDGHRTYKYVFNHFRAWLKSSHRSNYSPKNFSYLDAIAYTDKLITEGKNGRGFNNYKSIMGVFFNMLEAREIIEKNPFSRIPRARVEIGKNIAFNETQLLQLRTNMLANNNPMGHFCQFIFYSFIRPKELIQLQIKHIDFIGNKIIVPSHIAKNGKQDAVEIPVRLMETMQEMELDNLPGEYYIFGRGIKPGPMPQRSRNNVTEKHKKILTALRFTSEFTLYSWKHSGVCAAYRAGVQIYDIMRQCRHSSLDQTQIYLKSLGLLANTSFQNIEF